MAKFYVKKRKSRKKPGLWAPSLGFFMGMSIGFLISPIKQGMGNNSGNTTNNYYGKEQLKDLQKLKELKEEKKKEASK